MIGKAVFPGGNAQSLNDVAGQPIAEYTHAKSGTVHKLEGPVNAKNIVFKATGDYNDGDTWILNNTPVAVTYNGGEELIPTAVLVGDMVQAVVMGNQVRLMLQKPTPQPSISDNWNLTKPVNQRAKDEYIGGDIYTFDRWVLIYGDFGDTNVSLTSDGVKINGNGGIRQFLEADLKGRICTIAVLDSEDNLFIVTSPILHTKNPEWQISKSFKNLWIGFRFREDRGSTWGITIKTLDKALDKTFKAAKIEFGNRFTVWPAWNHETELRRCQKYFCRFDQVANGFITGSRTSMRLSAITPVTMRTKPALVDFEIRNVRTTSGSSITPVVTEAYIESLTQCGATIIVDSQTFNTEPYVNNTPISARIEGFLDANL